MADFPGVILSRFDKMYFIYWCKYLILIFTFAAPISHCQRSFETYRLLTSRNGYNDLHIFTVTLWTCYFTRGFYILDTESCNTAFPHLTSYLLLLFLVDLTQCKPKGLIISQQSVTTTQWNHHFEIKLLMIIWIIFFWIYFNLGYLTQCYYVCTNKKFIFWFRT